MLKWNPIESGGSGPILAVRYRDNHLAIRRSYPTRTRAASPHSPHDEIDNGGRQVRIV